MSIKLKVSLDKSTTPWSVDVDQKGNPNHVPRHNKAQTITWHLHGNAATGSFESFQWLDPQPDDGIFGEPSGLGTKELDISDLNDSAASEGTWTYRLGITVGDGTYYTIADIPTNTTTNPTIKNT